MSKFQHHLKSFTCDPGRLKPVIINICLWSLGVWEFGTPGAPGARQLVDKSVDNVDNWEFGEFGEFVGQEPNNSVYLAPLTNIQRQELIASIISAYTSVTIKSFARLVVKTTQLVIFIKKRTAKLSNSDKVDSSS